MITTFAHFQMNKENHQINQLVIDEFKSLI